VYEYRPVILTINKVFTDWGEFFFNDNVAVPIIDRIIHHHISLCSEGKVIG
jgi:DNA replication protein DnaC